MYLILSLLKFYLLYYTLFLPFNYYLLNLYLIFLNFIWSITY